MNKTKTLPGYSNEENKVHIHKTHSIRGVIQRNVYTEIILLKGNKI